MDEDLFGQHIKKKKQRVLVLLICFFALAGGGFIAQKEALVESETETATALAIAQQPTPTLTPDLDQLPPDPTETATPLVESSPILPAQDTPGPENGSEGTAGEQPDAETALDRADEGGMGGGESIAAEDTVEAATLTPTTGPLISPTPVEVETVDAASEQAGDDTIATATPGPDPGTNVGSADSDDAEGREAETGTTTSDAGETATPEGFGQESLDDLAETPGGESSEREAGGEETASPTPESSTGTEEQPVQESGADMAATLQPPAQLPDTGGELNQNVSRLALSAGVIVLLLIAGALALLVPKQVR